MRRPLLLGAGHLGTRAAITNIDRSAIRSVSVNRRVEVTGWNRVRYNGGRGGIAARASERQLAVARSQHMPATSVQLAHQRVASSNRQYVAAVNHERPPLAARIHPLVNTNRTAGAAPSVKKAVPQTQDAAAGQAVPRHAVSHAQAAEPVTLPQRQRTRSRRSASSRRNTWPHRRTVGQATTLMPRAGNISGKGHDRYRDVDAGDGGPPYFR